MNGAGGIDDALYLRKLQRVVETPQLKCSQRLQSSLILLLWDLIPQTNHPWDRQAQVYMAISKSSPTQEWNVLLMQWFLYTQSLPDPLQEGSRRMDSTSLYSELCGSTFRKSWLASWWHVTPARRRRVLMVDRRFASRSNAKSFLLYIYKINESIKMSVFKR